MHSLLSDGRLSTLVGGKELATQYALGRHETSRREPEPMQRYS